jgi:hypothetical protein
MGTSRSGEQFDRTDLFNPNRNDINPPSDNFSDARLPQRQCAQDRCDTRSDNRSDRYSNNAELQAFKEGYRQAYRDGFMDGQREQPVRVGRGQGSYCPEYNDYANSRQAYQEEAWLNRGDDFDRQQRRPIPQCRHRHQQTYSDSSDYRDYDRYSDRGSSRFGDVRAVSAGDYDYDRRDGRRGGNFLDRIFDVVGQVARGVSDVAYEAGPIIQTYAQLQMIKNGGIGGRYYGGGYNGGYYDRPYNPWNSVQNRNLIAYNNNSRYYDDYNPLWMNG